MTKVIFETGATSHAVNDLILFADNTRELAALRDKIYNRLPRSTNYVNFSVFFPLLDATINQYEKELRQRYVLTPNQTTEFCQLYANDFENWKAEHE